MDAGSNLLHFRGDNLRFDDAAEASRLGKGREQSGIGQDRAVVGLLHQEIGSIGQPIIAAAGLKIEIEPQNQEADPKGFKGWRWSMPEFDLPVTSPASQSARPRAPPSGAGRAIRPRAP